MFDSYILGRKHISSNPIKEMRRIKAKQVDYLYDLSADREDDTLLNGKKFVRTPRIFDMKKKDEVHTKIQVETVDINDRFVGDYLTYQGCEWICVHQYIFHDLYCHGEFQKCNTEIFWLNRSGKLCSQWCVDINSTQYNSGEFSDNTMRLGSSQHQLKMQCNHETVKIRSPKRFLIDKDIEEPTCYKVTQNDTSSANYGKGLCLVTIYESGRNTDKDKLITLEDGRKVWVADYFEANSNTPDDDKKDILSEIKYRYKKSFLGRKSIFNAVFKDEAGNILQDVKPKWEIVSDFNDALYIEETGSEIHILVSDQKLEGEQFTLKLISDDGTSSTASIVITIESLT